MTELLYIKRSNKRFPYHILGEIQGPLPGNWASHKYVSACGMYKGRYSEKFSTFTTHDEAPDEMICLHCKKAISKNE